MRGSEHMKRKTEIAHNVFAVLGMLIIGSVLLFAQPTAQADDKPPSCTTATTETTIITQCNDGTVTIVNQATNTAMVCNSSKSPDGTPKCVTQNLSKSN